MTDRGLRERKDCFTTFDGTKLVYRSWIPENPNGHALVLLHRGHEHSGRLTELAEVFARDNYSCFAYDSRGHGESPGPKGYCENFSYLVKDLDRFVSYISTQYKIDITNIIVLANSMSSVVTSVWVHDYAPKIRGMILVAPAFRIKLYVPFALTGLRILQHFKTPLFIKSYVKSSLLTHDKDEQFKYNNDRLITKNISVNILTGFFDAAKRIVSDAAAIETPTLILSAGSDWVVYLKDQKKFYDSLSSKIKEMEVYPNYYHGVLYEKEREVPIRKAQDFISTLFKYKEDRSGLLNRDKEGPTKEEYDRLLSSPPPIKRIVYTMTRFFMSTLGKLSKGISIGIKYGYDSGLSLDHVYGNKAEGITPLGKLIDYLYLNSVGWRGIRTRKSNLQKLLDESIEKLVAQRKPIRILDIASGPGRYLIETAKKFEDRNINILLCDNKQENIDKGQELVRTSGAKNVVFKLNDAFDKSSYSKLNFMPNIVVISGLHELFSDNQKVLESLNGVRSIAEDECTIIYTGQPWHPQLEFIAYTLKNREDKRWVMRRRNQAELDYLYENSGFKKQDMEIDSWGIFTVSRALTQ
ncbi:MAG: hypothetical protein A2653_01885 [Candidatus Zambryskibacteria bacterium RIFCSPHIGHO2_01_FULL_43_25]|uniref:Serine aminopeptidase S33 domain-containing protein n=1 Tax=Candidatus Zambryskibacteria bacterium RIFCSPLOWO2_01_FULL_45_21 TaxID=1802761 RepID=A0A1G2U615_9BACT|nr:MAG: hypothetical protein A2653_01885 [Candidatus Zambryskibacteria bacterium RIFCSPHIGHO2_01_FULL_43_25]OHB04322.1 MAG: hypothetical protein A3B14_02530 [Candidatus Zambryskibacteria bacterium RIFCSPLOWO2_01_FULL_45_21]